MATFMIWLSQSCACLFLAAACLGRSSYREEPGRFHFAFRLMKDERRNQWPGSRTKASQHCTPMCAHTFGRDYPAFDLSQPVAVNLLLTLKRAETTSMILWAIFVILLI